MGVGASLFWSTDPDAQTLHKRITPSTEERDYLQEQWSVLGEFLIDRLEQRWESGVSSWIQGSYKFGTLLRPLYTNDRYDLDLGMYLEFDGNEENQLPIPRTLKRWVHEDLVSYCDVEAEAVRVPPEKARCSRIVFKKNFHVDIPSYKLNTSGDNRHLATKTGNWEDSDPKKLYVWFLGSTPEKSRRQLRRIIKYVKAWAKIHYRESKESCPSSLMLTVIVTEAFQSLSPEDKAGDDTCLAAALRYVLGRLAGSKAVPNPVNSAEDLNRLGKEDFHKLLDNLEEFLTVAEEALLCGNKLLAAVKWSEAFEHFFPLPPDDEVSAGKFPLAIPQPEIEIRASDKRTGRTLGVFQNEVSRVQAQADLQFTITNPQFIPAGATITWTVRNEDSHAAEANDLGHTTIGGISNSEHTAYRGKHYMDCVVSKDGRVLSVRRVPVTVATPFHSKAVRNPAKPSWTKIRRKRRRRR
jgi:hypothetical protein